jgi:hypothetical protein
MEFNVLLTVHHSISDSETNVMHFLFSLLRIIGLYMFPALLAHPQEALHNGTSYIVCVVYQMAAPGLKLHFNPGAAN